MRLYTTIIRDIRVIIPPRLIANFNGLLLFDKIISILSLYNLFHEYEDFPSYLDECSTSTTPFLKPT
jgi:hypothetical protein